MTVYKNLFFVLYGTLVDIRTDELKPSLWRGAAEFYSLCGAPYAAAEIRTRYLALCAEETQMLAEAHPALGAEGVEIELRNVFRRLFEEKDVPVTATQVEDTAVLFRLLSFCRRPRLMKGAKRTLSGLRRQGARMYLLSNAQSCFTIPELRQLGLLDGVFDADIRGADSVGMESRYLHSWQSPPRGFRLPESCREIMSLEELLEGHLTSELK